MNPLDLSAAHNRWSGVPAAEKLCFYGGLLLCAMLLPPRTGAPLVLLVVAVSTLVFARVQVRLFLLAMLGPLVFIMLGALPIAVSLRGGPHWEPGGVDLALDTALRALAASTATISLAMTTLMADLLDLARRAGTPPALCHVADLTYRLVGILLRSALRAREAVGLRLGLRRPRDAITVIGTQFALIFIRGTDRARAMSEAMSLRADPGATAVLTSARPVRASRLVGTAALLAAIAAVATLTWLGWKGWHGV